MAINQNHLFEDLDGVKCAIVEKNASAQRVVFLQALLAFNRYTVVVVPSPPPKAAPVSPAVVAPAAGSGSIPATVPASSPAETVPLAPSPAGTAAPASAPPVIPPPPETFTVGVTDTTFNPINAIFGRSLHAPDGHVVTLAYWQQAEKVSHDEIPYFETGKP